VQPHVDEVRGHLEQQRKSSGRISHDQSDAMGPQQVVGPGGAKRLIAHLEAMPQWTIGADPGPAAAGQPLVVLAGQITGFGRRARQPRQELSQDVLIEGQVRRQLPEDGPEFGLQRQHPGGEEVGQRRVDIAQLLQMGDEAAALDREHEVGRRLFGPAVIGLGTLQSVKRAVDLDRSEPLGRVGQFGPLR
jgi:hypothetical protein